MKTFDAILIIAGLLVVGCVIYFMARPTGDDDSGGSGNDDSGGSGDGGLRIGTLAAVDVSVPTITSGGSRSASPLNLQDAVRVNLSI